MWNPVRCVKPRHIFTSLGVSKGTKKRCERFFAPGVRFTNFWMKRCKLYLLTLSVCILYSSICIKESHMFTIQIIWSNLGVWHEMLKWWYVPQSHCFWVDMLIKRKYKVCKASITIDGMLYLLVVSTDLKNSIQCTIKFKLEHIPSWRWTKIYMKPPQSVWAVFRQLRTSYSMTLSVRIYQHFSSRLLCALLGSWNFSLDSTTQPRSTEWFNASSPLLCSLPVVQ